MTEARKDTWINYPTSAAPLLDYIGKHLVAYPFNREEEKAGGQCIAINPTSETVSLRRYDTGEITEFPWTTTRFRHPRQVEDPFAGLRIDDKVLFEWFDGVDNPPVTLTGVVDERTSTHIAIWTEGGDGPPQGWWAYINANDAARHSLRPANPPENVE